MHLVIPNQTFLLTGADYVLQPVIVHILFTWYICWIFLISSVISWALYFKTELFYVLGFGVIVFNSTNLLVNIKKNPTNQPA